MAPEDLDALKHRKPFLPFRVTLIDGRAYEVVHPQLMMVGGRDLMIGFPRKGSDRPIFERHVWVPFADIQQVDMLAADKALKTKEPGCS